MDSAKCVVNGHKVIGNRIIIIIIIIIIIRITFTSNNPGRERLVNGQCPDRVRTDCGFDPSSFRLAGHVSY